MLEIKSVKWRNFLSYGDYESVLSLEDPGSCLITGEIDSGNSPQVGSEDIRKSNGSGKSSIPNVVLWGLFGRTMHASSAGDSIINHFTGKTCEVIIDFKNGDQIIRRRQKGGTTEVLFSRDGDETRISADTVSTSKAMQSQLNKTFNLDYDIFCGSVFFNQYGRSWMEMSEVARKKALEKILRVDRFSFYAKIAKAKSDNAQFLFTNFKSKIIDLEANRDRTISDIQSYREESGAYEIKRAKRISDIDMMITTVNDKMNKITIPDIDKLTEKWKLIEKIKAEIDRLKSEDAGHFRTIATIESNISVLKKRRDEVNKLQGKSCVSCQQSIPSSMITNNLDKIEKELATFGIQLADATAAREESNKVIKKYETMLSAKIPNITIMEANNLSTIVLNYKAEIKRLMALRVEAETDSDPNQTIIERLDGRLKDILDNIVKHKSDLEDITVLDKHYTYLYKSYNDRNKVKSFMCEEHLPYINSRLEHYLGILGLDIKIKIENDLRITSNMWGYEYQSGGERKRTDLAFMLASYDFYEVMYGRQCNLMVLDEVDGRMDEDGIEGLISIIRNDLSSRIDNILIISHRNQMFDVFDRELKVKRINRFSILSGN